LIILLFQLSKTMVQFPCGPLGGFNEKCVVIGTYASGQVSSPWLVSRFIAFVFGFPKLHFQRLFHVLSAWWVSWPLLVLPERAEGLPSWTWGFLCMEELFFFLSLPSCL
jgi:hypothetical protein